jgi:ppGpp synthetase/RelA/SpoT-type nucleotidyltranferase
VAAGDFTAIVDAYEAERSDYEALALVVADGVREALNARGMETVVIWRAKDTLSFAKKALRKPYVDPMAEIGDKAGVRVIVHYLDDVPIVEEIVRTLCDVQERKEKLEALDYDKLGYLGVHLQVQPNADLAARSGNGRVGDLQAELQIHTKAQSAWATVSHDLLYKTPWELPNRLKRDVTRLVALVELFDGEVQRFVETIKQDPDFEEMSVAHTLDDLIVRYTERRPDGALSALSIPSLVRLYGSEPGQLVAEEIEPFVDANGDKLDELYDRYRQDHRANPLLFQPEALLIFERLDNDPDRLVASWPTDVLPIELLDDLASIWGADVDVIGH